MEINSAKFICSNKDWKKCPEIHQPEYAFIGRSNVGKSTLINCLTNSKKLAKTSGKPGKTQLINHFHINNAFLFADLPGYGYAKVSKKDRANFQDFTLKYLQNRKNLICLFLLIDIRLSPQKIDLEFMEYCAIKKIPFMLCFTKADKLKKREIFQMVEAYENKLFESWEILPEYFITSSINDIGKEEMLSFIAHHNQSFS